MRYLLLLLTAITLASCNTTKRDIRNLEKIDKAIVVVKKPLDDNSKVYVDAAIKILQKDPTRNDITLRLLTDAQTIIGIPKESNKLDVAGLINKDPVHIATLTALEVKDKEAIKQLDTLKEKKEVLTAKIIEDTKKELAIQKTFLQRIKAGVEHYLMITAGILLVLFVGPSILKAVFNISLSFTPLGFLRNLFK